MDTTSLVSAWNALLLHLCCVFTAPTAEVWRQIALGWVLRRGPATVTGIVRTLGRLADRHWTVYERFFYRAAWSLDALSRALLEEAIQEAKQHLGFSEVRTRSGEDTRGWCPKTVRRQAPLAMVLLTLTKASCARCAAAEPSLAPAPVPWHAKTHPSFADMLAALRGVLWRHRITPKSGLSARVRGILETVAYALSAAA